MNEQMPNVMGQIMVSAPPMGAVIGEDHDQHPLIADDGSILVTAIPDADGGHATTMLFNLDDSKELIASLIRARRAAKKQMKGRK